MPSDISAAIAVEMPRLRRYARALTRDIDAAEDLVQEALLRGLTKQHLWKEGTNLRAWLFSILHNTHVNHVRIAIREQTVFSLKNADDLPEFLRQTPAIQDHGLQVEEAARLLNRLPEPYRTPIILIAKERTTYAAVAQRIGIPEGTVRSRLSRGRAVLRQLCDGKPTVVAFGVKVKPEMTPRKKPAVKPASSQWKASKR